MYDPARPKFTTDHAGRQPLRYTSAVANFAIEIEDELDRAQARPFARRRRIRRRRRVVPGPSSTDKASQCEDAPHLPYIPSSGAWEPLVAPIETDYLMENAWTAQGAGLTVTALSSDLTLQEAWDIGKTGCYAKVTATRLQRSQTAGYWPASSQLRFLVMDGTADGTFLTLHSGGDADMYRLSIPRKVATISWRDLQNARWSDLQTSVHFVLAAGTWDIRIEDIPAPFYAAMISCIRFNYGCRVVSQIQRRRFFIRQFEFEEGYLRALRHVLWMSQLLHRLCLDGEANFPEKASLDPREYVPSEPLAASEAVPST